MRSQRNRFSSNNHSFLPLPFPTNFPISSNQTTMFNLLRSTSTRVASSSSSSMLLATAVAGPSRISMVGRVGASSSSSSACSPPSLKRSYHEKVLDHYNKPRNVGSMNKTDEDVGTGLVGAPACGDVMKLQIRVDENGIISDVRFKTFGCGSAIASSSFITEHVKGMTLDQAGKVKNTEIAKELSLPPVKLHCSMLAEDAIKSAIRDYKTKRAAAGLATGALTSAGLNPAATPEFTAGAAPSS
ncbi:NifU-like N terminal domain-containing protein [Mrakia frigida]|uniref:iron-sulfur cluster assembly scaffold protein n=1 Tax=Mrakia frigida TaxID=29902 RepID=UPI003FCC0EDB